MQLADEMDSLLALQDKYQTQQGELKTLMAKLEQQKDAYAQQLAEAQKQTGKCRLWQIVSRSCLMAALDAVLTYRKKLWEMPVCPRHHRQGMCNILNSYFILFRLKGIKVDL